MAIIPVPPDPLDSVFVMVTPQHVFAKLCWEVRSLRRALARAPETAGDIHAPAYIAFNCSVTAWHLTDWAWAAATNPETRADLLTSLDVATSGDSKRDFSNFQAALRRKHRALHIARQIATGSKHAKVTVHPDPEVRTEMQWDVQPARVGEVTAGSPLNVFRYDLLVSDHGETRSAIDIFEEMLEVWRRLLEEWGFIEPTFVEGARISSSDI